MFIRLPATILIVSLVLISGWSAASGAGVADKKTYLKDYEFIQEVVLSKAAAIKSKQIDFKSAAARMKAQFASATSDQEHARNVMELLAVLQDSHSDLFRTQIKGLPSKWEGLYGGGLFFGYEQGKFVLRGLMEKHNLQSKIPPGSILVSIGEQPAWLALARDRRRIAKYRGISSDHSLYSSISNKLLPFGEERTLKVTFLVPDGEFEEVMVDRWGPGGKSFSFRSVEIPQGVELVDGACSAMLREKWCQKIGYLRITGSMNQQTVEAFHQALEPLKEMEALILDCRWMGGGNDGSAWEMAGRFYPDGVDNGFNGFIDASGDWQFDGPVVMLQNENMVSSAETFTWAMSEPGRVISVGRNTGGWGIIPRVFDLPSGLGGIRVGVTDRGTPIKRIHTEGVGWPADLTVPFGPVLCQEPDPVRMVGMAVLEVLHAGFPVDKVREDFQDLLGGSVNAFKKAGVRYGKKIKTFKPERLAKMVLEDLEGELKMEAQLLGEDGIQVGDAVGATRRLEGLLGRGKAAGLKGEVSRLQKVVKAQKNEAAAQEALLELLDQTFAAGVELEQLDARKQKAFLSRFGKTRTGRFAKEHLWK